MYVYSFVYSYIYYISYIIFFIYMYMYVYSFVYSYIYYISYIIFYIYIYIYISSNIGGLDRVDDVNLARAIISIMSWMPSTLPLLPMVLVVNLRSECDDEDHPSKYFSCKLKVKKKRHLFPIVMYKRKLIQSINTGSNKKFKIYLEKWLIKYLQEAFLVLCGVFVCSV